jgi:16S rRNA C967 or C1407 C5-methylase (RsmB/RsmF family)
MIERLTLEQKQIFKEALTFLKPGGHIVYATCSVLPQENEKQMEYFIKNFTLEQVGIPFSSFPRKGEMDGFFGVVFKKKKD